MKKIFRLFWVVLAVATQSCQPQEQPSKVWLHRANDVAKAQYFQDQYAGLELDVYYADSLNTFIVMHGGFDEVPIKLTDWFSSIKNRKRLGFWIDFKNLNESNMIPAAKELQRIRRTYHLKGMMIVESSNAQCLKAFNDRHFRTSYYIPFAIPDRLSHKELQKLTDSIHLNIQTHELKTISGYWFQYQFMMDSFPEMRKLIWYELYDTAVRNQYIRLANEDGLTDVILVAVTDTIDYAHAISN
jgi:hypothetical protein